MSIVDTDHRPADWWKSAVVYQIYPRSFADSNGDGIGDLRGIVGKLDYLEYLGVDVIWLSPVFRSPQDDNGYDISDYQSIDPIFGSMDDFDELIAGSHRRGMRLVMDLVVNHTSDEHPWFQASRQRRESKDEWYWWADPRPGFRPGAPGAEPTNWRSVFSGPAWQWDGVRGQYYLHVFGRKQPDLNWENPEVRQAIHEMMNWWVSRGVDGFRMDVINHISKPLPLADDGVVTNGPRMDEFLHEMFMSVLDGKELFTVGECPAVSVEQAANYTDPSRRELNMVFQFEHMTLDEHPGLGKWALKPLSVPELKANLAKWQNGLEGRGWNSLYWSNHDQPRIVSRWGDDSPEHRINSAKTLGTVLHLQKGTPYIYQGEELGMVNAGFTSIDQYRDIEILNHWNEARAAGADETDLLEAFRTKGRDNARTPIPWDETELAGFTTGKPWLEINDHSAINVASEMKDPNSVLYHYRKLIALRHELEVVRRGVFALLEPSHEQLFAFTRTLADERLLVVANLSSTTIDLPEAVQSGGEVILATHAEREPGRLAAWESRVIRP